MWKITFVCKRPGCRCRYGNHRGTDGEEERVPRIKTDVTSQARVLRVQRSSPLVYRLDLMAALLNMAIGEMSCKAVAFRPFLSQFHFSFFLLSVPLIHNFSSLLCSYTTPPLYFLFLNLGVLRAALLPLLVFTIWEISSLKIRCRSDVKK